jgi:hypothetical protein
MKETEKEMGKTLTTERKTKSPLEIKLSMKESSNSHGEDLGVESHAWKEKKQRENCFCREGGHRSIFEDRQTGLTGITNRSDQSPLTNRINSPKMDYLLSRKNLMTRSEGISKS